MSTIATTSHAARARYLGAAAAAAAAIVYYLIGLGVLTVGRNTQDPSADLFAFGVLAGTAFVVIAAVLMRFRSRVLWLLIGLFQVLVIVMYVVVSSRRDPPFEAWGLIIKALQVVVLGSMAYLIVRRG